MIKMGFWLRVPCFGFLHMEGFGTCMPGLPFFFSGPGFSWFLLFSDEEDLSDPGGRVPVLLS